MAFLIPHSVNSRSDLVLWWCMRHNEVNRKLGKPEFPCDLQLLDKRWRKGDDDCVEND
jgi:mitochondrial FAD-linked sulfhydryl oxidase